MRLVTDCVVIARWGLLVLSVVMLTGHICVLPTHGHVEAAPSHSDGEHSHDVDESMHAASCEALPSSWITCQAVLAISASGVSVHVEPTNRSVNRGGISPLPKVSPPLLLLHAALLI
jgi:hypothetical protein